MKSLSIALVAGVSLITFTGVLAQQANQAPANSSSNSATAPTTDTDPTPGATRDDTPRTATSAKQGLSKLDSKTSSATVRASKLIGANLTNSNDERVGEINDLVMDATSGKIRYVAVTYGGFLGLGSKMFAVPFEAFRVRQNTSAVSPGDYTLTLDVTKEQLEGAQGFDNDHWPDFANTSFTQELDRRYNVERKQTR